MACIRVENSAENRNANVPGPFSFPGGLSKSLARLPAGSVVYFLIKVFRGGSFSWSGGGIKKGPPELLS